MCGLPLITYRRDRVTNCRYHCQGLPVSIGTVHIQRTIVTAQLNCTTGSHFQKNSTNYLLTEPILWARDCRSGYPLITNSVCALFHWKRYSFHGERGFGVIGPFLVIVAEASLSMKTTPFSMKQSPYTVGYQGVSTPTIPSSKDVLCQKIISGVFFEKRTGRAV